MRNNFSLFATTVLLLGTVTANRFVNTASQQAGAGDNAYGVADSSGVIDDAISVSVIGTAVIEVGAAISAGALVESDASGRAITRTTGAILGRLAPDESAAAAGEFIEIILITN